MANNSTLDNQGTIRAEHNLSFDKASAFYENSGTIFIAAGQTVSVLNNTTLKNHPDGTIEGAGTLNVTEAKFTNNGHISPGASTGTLSITGLYSQSSRGTLDMEIDSATEYDRLHISGDASLNGILNLRLADGYLPVLGKIAQFAKDDDVPGLLADLEDPEEFLKLLEERAT